MRVLFISNLFPPMDVGGAEIAASNTSFGLCQRGVDVSVMLINGRWVDDEDRHYDVRCVPVHLIGLRRPEPDTPSLQAFDPRVYRAVMAELRRIKPHLVHIHNVSGASLAPLVACRRQGIPQVLTLHDHWLLCPNNMLYQKGGVLCNPAQNALGCSRCFQRYDFWADIPRRRQRFARLVRETRFFISPSQRLIDLHAAAGYDRRRFRVVPHGIIPTLFQPPSDPRVIRVARDCGLYRTLLFAGAVVESKGIQILTEALPAILEQVRRIRLVVAGSGEERFLQPLRAFGESTVTLLGRVPFQEMWALYASADLTIVPSTWYDNSPMVIGESLLAGTPVIGADIGGIPELIQIGSTGQVFPPGDAAALAEQVLHHFRRPPRERRAMRRRCAEYARSEMTMDRHIDAHLEIYNEALKG